MADLDLHVSIVLGTYDRAALLQAAIASVRDEVADIGHELIVVDGGSTDGSLEWLVEQEDVITIVHHNRGGGPGGRAARRSWGYFMNLGFRAATGTYVCMLSDDSLVVPGAIRNGIELFERESAAGRTLGAVAFNWRNWPEDRRYRVGVSFGERVFVNHGMYRRAALEAVGYIDADAYAFYHADADLCMRLAEAGYPCVAGEQSFVEHYRKPVERVRRTNQQSERRDWATFASRWESLGEPQARRVEREFDDETRTAERYWGSKEALRLARRVKPSRLRGALSARRKGSSETRKRPPESPA